MRVETQQESFPKSSSVLKKNSNIQVSSLLYKHRVDFFMLLNVCGDARSTHFPETFFLLLKVTLHLFQVQLSQYEIITALLL